MRLGVATICPHIYHEGQWWSYEPYVLEMNVWLELFDQLIIVAPHDQGPPPESWVPYRDSSSIKVIPFRRDRGRGLLQDPASPGEIPRMLYAVIKAALTSDAFHVRAPGNIALIASLLVPLFQKRLVAKFAGQWIGAPGEARTVRWQRAILKSNWWRGPVTVYGDWPNQPPQIVPFFTSVLNQQQMARAQASAATRKAGGWANRNLRLLYVGRLSASKNVMVILEALAQLKPSVTIECDIVGDGPERAALEQFTDEHGLREQVRFSGNVSFDQVLEFYEQADALALVSASEGWGKAITEAMAFGLICIGSDRGVIPWLLGEERGVVVPPNDATALGSALRRIATNPAEHFKMGQQAAEWSQRFSLEGLGKALRELLSKHWRLPEFNRAELDSRPDKMK